MNTDPTQPWGVAIDYAGRGLVTEGGHVLRVHLYDNNIGGLTGPDPITGEYPTVYVSAQLTESGPGDVVLRGDGLSLVNGEGGRPVVPDPTAVPRAVEAALADFERRRAAYEALCATWTPAPPTGPAEPTEPAEPADPADPAA
ncbi:ATP-binding protein [Streptomyces laurentii]|uniref:ATP-binding protein n=1 Tax=Streptomyces laurentii TaxID=39478 RepID=UPI0036C2CDCB